MIGNEIKLVLVEGGRWRVHGDAPAGFHVPGMPRGEAELALAVSLSLRVLGYDMYSLDHTNVEATAVFGRISQ